MATLLQASIYGVNQYDWNNAEGQILGFPTALTVVRPAPANTTRSGLTMNAVIQLQPTGLNQGADQYYTSATVASLITLANTADS